ncbi:MAG: SpoIIE family protein phosphatase [Propionibacteriales bacterium]|nr:SpoIIE family protein phosphatase [Propionibacteriales bacterium]
MGPDAVSLILVSLAGSRTTWRRSPAVWRIRRRINAAVRHAWESDNTWLIGLALLCVVLAVGVVQHWMPLSAFVIPVLVGGLVLSLRRLIRLLAVAAITLVASAALIGFGELRITAVVVVALVGGVMLWNARSRSQLGVVGTRGDSMLIDLRDRLRSQGELPELSDGWYTDAVLRSAGRASFAGDFMVAERTRDDLLEVVVVDVSGKGINAGTRALALSGALGGLLGSLPPEEFLPAANAYLLRRDWGEGFATAVHLALDLRDGSFELRTAGHPPAVQLHAGSGRWAVLSTDGPVLGLMEHAEFAVCGGRLLPGDAMLLYTDGLVETRQRDISLGIDKLVGQAERLVTGGFDGGAARLIDRMPSHNDDRALLLLHRR